MTTNHFDITDLAALDALVAQEHIDLTLGQARTVTKAIKENLDALPSLIMLSKKAKVYKKLGYTSIDEWAKVEFGLSRSRIYQLNNLATAEHAMRNRFNLSAGFALAEGQFRPLTSDLEGVLNTIAADLADADIADTESAREQVVNHSVNKMIKALERNERASRVKVASASADITPKDETASANNVIPYTPQSRNDFHGNREISAVPMSYGLALVKAKDTGKSLANLSADVDADLVRETLLDAQTVIAELLAFVSTAAVAA